MRRGVAFLILVLVGAGVTACGRTPFEQREPWRLQAEEACLSQKLVQPSAYMSRRAGISGPGACGMQYPFTVAAFGDGTVGVPRQATLACPIIPRIDGWLAEVVQPAAQAYFGLAVAEVRSGSYSCRPRNHRVGAKLSEHSFGNALDVMGFRLADGREVTVVKGWRGAAEEQEFLREVFVGACERFTTVLGPGSDALHYDHFHLDLARHDPRGMRRVCKPLLNWTPRLPARSDEVAEVRAGPAEPPPIEMEEEGEPEVVGAAPPRREAPATWDLQPGASPTAASRLRF